MLCEIQLIKIHGETVKLGRFVVWYYELNSPSVLTVRRRFGTEFSRKPPKRMFTYM